MLIDVISDTHFDSHFTELEPSDDKVIAFWKQSDPKADTLIIAGDIGHYNLQNFSILKSLRRHFYRNIVLVLGNHDYYIREGVVKYFKNGNDALIAKTQEFSTSKERIEDFKNLCAKIEGVYLLDGDTIEIEGVKLGGAMGWYDGCYSQAFNSYAELQRAWQESMDDDIYIKPKIAFDGFLNIELAKIERVLAQTPDIMITHVNPSICPDHQHPIFKNDVSTGFYSYNGQKHINAFYGQYWIFGHTHFSAEFDIDGRFKLLTNALGYEKTFQCKTIEVINGGGCLE